MYVVEPKFPFSRLAILGGDVNEKEVESVMNALADDNFQPNYSGYSDSRRSLRPNSSLGDSAMLGSSASSQSGLDSSRFERSNPSQQLGGPSTSTISLAEQTIDELTVAAPIETRAGSLHEASSAPMSPAWHDYGDADFSTHGGRKPGQGGLNGGGEGIRSLLRELDPLSHILSCKRKKKCLGNACKWDLFPGIRVGEESRKRRLPMQAFSHLQSDKFMAEEQPSPRGPLSVDSTGEEERTSSSERDLARTFGLHELESSENMSSEGSEGWSVGSSAKSSSRPPPERQTQSAPNPDTGPKEPKASALRPSVTSPELHTNASLSVKDTAKLNIERYQGMTFVNEYALAGTLGRGSFGTVKLALNTRDHELYALKLIPKSRKPRHRHHPAGAPLVAEADVMQEIDVMKTLSHPNIVRLVEVIDDPANSKMLMVLEYVEGGSLFAGTKIAPKKRLTELSARKYFRDVLKGLDYLHANQLAHGDLKPDNLLLGADGRVKIADFGSSQLTRCCDLVQRTAGTPAFMAPEMCSGQPYHARLADVWALGVCLYMFLFGVVPFKADSILGLYDKICNAPLEFPPNVFVSDSLKHLITRLLDKDPETRISLTSVMCHHWVTHNGAYPLPNIQGLEPDEEEDETALLMECWPDDPADIGLESVLKTITPLFEQRRYPDGSLLATQGSPSRCIFFVQEGAVEVFHRRREDADSEGEEEGSDGEGDEIAVRRRRLKRDGNMLKTMFCATVRASKLVSAVRDYADGESTLLATRGPGSFIGEVQVFARGMDAVWQTCVRAKGQVTVLVLHFKEIMELVAKRPEVEGDIRAVMAQRRGELMKMEMLEKLAGLHRDLRQEVELVTAGGGANPAAIATARELLGLPAQSCEGAALELPGSEAAVGACDEPASPGLKSKPSANALKVEVSRESFETKGDSAKTLNLYSKMQGEVGGKAAPPLSPVESVFAAPI